MTDRNEHLNQSTTNSGGILERNVEQLLTRAHEPPLMELSARGRILDALKGELSVEPESSVTRWFELPRVRLAAFAGACVILLAVFSQLPGDRVHKPVVHQNDDVAPRWVTLEDGSRILLNRDARISVLSRRHVMLDRGELLLDVAKGDGEFIVDAPYGRVVVLGTRFVLNSADDKTWAAVVRGKVRLQNAQGEQTLSAGEQGSMSRGAAPTRRAGTSIVASDQLGEGCSARGRTDAEGGSTRHVDRACGQLATETVSVAHAQVDGRRARGEPGCACGD